MNASAEGRRTPKRRDHPARFNPCAIVAALALLPLASCVTETSGRSRPARTLPASVSTSDPGASPAEPAKLPTGPIAKPAPAGSSFSTSVSISLLPLGLVPYDGLVLPLISPDGRFLVTQHGDPPSWPTVLAGPDSSPALGSKTTVYDLTGAAVREVPAPEAALVGSILGRSCDSRGYLIEWPRPDGSRWIGLRSWVTGAVDWLARDEAVNAHAVGGDQLIVFTTRPVSGAESSLVVRYRGGVERTLSTPGASYLLPILSPDSRVAVVIARTGRGLELLAVRTLHSDGATPAALSVIARRVLDASNDPALAYQALASVQSLVGRPLDAAAADQPAILFYPALRRMALFDWTNAAIVPLAEASVGAVLSPLPQSPGYFQTVPKGVIYTPPPSVSPQASARPAPEARVTDIPYLVRATLNPDRPFVLFGPADGKRLQVLLMAPAPQGATNVLPPQ